MKRLLNNTCQKFIDFLDRDHTCTSTERAQMYYGLQNLLYNIFIIMTIFLSAYILDIPAETFLLFVFFNMLRLTAGGYHFNNIMLCLICTALLMVGGGKCVQLLQISTPHMYPCMPAGCLDILELCTRRHKKTPLFPRMQHPAAKTAPHPVHCAVICCSSRQTCVS